MYCWYYKQLYAFAVYYFICCEGKIDKPHLIKHIYEAIDMNVCTGWHNQRIRMSSQIHKQQKQIEIVAIVVRSMRTIIAFYFKFNPLM